MREKEQHRSSMMLLPRQLEEILWKSYARKTKSILRNVIY